MSKWTVSLRREGETEWPAGVEVTDVVLSTRVPGQDGETCVLFTIADKEASPFGHLLQKGTRIEIGGDIDGIPSPRRPIPWAVWERGDPVGRFTTHRIAETGFAWACVKVSPAWYDSEERTPGWRLRFEPAPEECGIRAMRRRRLPADWYSRSAPTGQRGSPLPLTERTCRACAPSPSPPGLARQRRRR